MIVIIAASIGGVAAIIAAVLGLTNRSKIAEVHVLVNHRLDEALMEIAQLKDQRHVLLSDAAKNDKKNEV
jgi:hypothetical protein